MKQKLLAFWYSLPHQLQAAIVTFVTAAGVTVTHAIADGTVPSSWADVKHLAGTGIVAGVAALRLFYMLPNGTGKAAAQNSAPPPPPDVPKP